MTPSERLEHFRERAAEHAGTEVAAKARLRARAVCEKHGLAVPDWAARVSHSEAGRRARQVGAQPRKQRGVRPSVARAERPVTVEHPPAVAVELPPELRAWRERRPGSVVSVGQAGVTLYPFSGEPRRYASMAEAISAIESTL